MPTARVLIVPVIFVLGGWFEFATGHIVVGVLTVAFALLLGSLAVIRFADRRPQAWIMPDGLRLRTYWYSQPDDISWRDVTDVSPITSFMGFTRRGKPMEGVRQHEAWATLGYSHYFAVKTTAGSVYKIVDPGRTVTLEAIRARVIAGLETARRRP